MKKSVETSQEPIDIKNALENDEELSNSHIYQNAPKVDVGKAENIESSDDIPVKATESKGTLKAVFKWFGIVVIFILLGVLGLWVYTNKAILFPANTFANQTARITNVNEGNTSSNKPTPNPYVTERDLRNTSKAIRDDIKLALREFSTGLDKIDHMQRQISGIKGQVNELKTLVAQNVNNKPSEDTDGRYKNVIRKLSEIDEALKIASDNSEKLAVFEQVNKDRKTLENQFKNNDWDLRKRMMVIEEINGVDPKAEKRPKVSQTSHKKVKANKYSAYMTSEPVKKAPKIEKKVIYEKVKIDSSKAVVWKNKHRWKIRMISNALTQVQNIDTKRKLTISEGVEVSGCGIVLDIDVSDRKVTTQHCIISIKGK